MLFAVDADAAAGAGAAAPAEAGADACTLAVSASDSEAAEAGIVEAAEPLDLDFEEEGFFLDPPLAAFSAFGLGGAGLAWGPFAEVLPHESQCLHMVHAYSELLKQ
jgi:hypothetical protein